MGDRLGTPSAADKNSNINAAWIQGPVSKSVPPQVVLGMSCWCPTQVERLQSIQPIPVGS